MEIVDDEKVLIFNRFFSKIGYQNCMQNVFIDFVRIDQVDTLYMYTNKILNSLPVLLKVNIEYTIIQFISS